MSRLVLSPRRLFYARAPKYLATHRRSPFVQWLDAWCRSIHRWVENSNYNPLTNGERRALASLTDVRTIFDVGANVGEWALMAHRLHPRARIHAFEIVPETCEILCRNTAGVPEIAANCFGLGEVRGVVPVKHFPAGSCASSTVDFPHPLDSVTVYCRVEPGDQYVREHGIERIDMLKIDVEGAEMRVLQGLEETISAGRVRAIQFEYSRLNIVARCFLRDLYEFLVARGYRVGKIYPTYVDFRDYSFDHEDFIGPNYLAIRR